MIFFYKEGSLRRNKKNENAVRLCTYGMHLPYCPEYGIEGTLTSPDKVVLDITPSLNGFLSRGQKPEKVNFKIYTKPIKYKPIKRPPYYWELKWDKKCYNKR